MRKRLASITLALAVLAVGLIAFFVFDLLKNYGWTGLCTRSVSYSLQDKVPEYITEQYKAYLADIANLGTRYTTIQAFYVSIIAALLGVLSFKEADSPRALMGTTVFLVFGFIFLLCCLWFWTVWYFHDLFDLMFADLREMESSQRLYPLFSNRCLPYPGLTMRESYVAEVIGIGAAIIAITAAIKALLERPGTLPDYGGPGEFGMRQTPHIVCNLCRNNSKMLETTELWHRKHDDCSPLLIQIDYREEVSFSPEMGFGGMVKQAVEAAELRAKSEACPLECRGLNYVETVYKKWGYRKSFPEVTVQVCRRCDIP
jgi:hypothetical protein